MSVARRMQRQRKLRARRERGAELRRHTSTVTPERLQVGVRLAAREYRDSFQAFARFPNQTTWKSAERARRERDFVDRLAVELLMRGEVVFKRPFRHQALLCLLSEDEVARGVTRVRVRRQR